MSTASSVIEAGVKAFAKDITKFLTDKRTEKITKLKKASKDPKEDPGKKLVTVTFRLSTRKPTLKRSPEQQAAEVADWDSKSCSSAHMVDKARHVDMMYGAAGKKTAVSWNLKGAFGTGDQHFLTQSQLETKWVALMKKHDLRNSSNGTGWDKGDSFHFEIPDSKVPKSDPLVQKCLIHYAKLTRLGDKKPYDKFENHKAWKAAVAPHIKKAEAEAKKIADKERLELLKKMKFEGSLSGTQTLLTKSNKNEVGKGKSWGSIDVPSPIESGGAKATKKTSGSALIWDSLARSIFEKIGLTETKGFDVKLSCGVTYNLVSYENLSQTFLTDLTPTCALIYNTPVSSMMKMSVTAKSSIKLGKSDTAPNGTIVFDILLTSPLDTEKGVITVTLKNGLATAVAKMK